MTQNIKITVTAFIFHKDSLLLIKHKKTGNWLPVGGHSEPGETLDETLKREIKEEVNLDIRFLEDFEQSKDIPEDPSVKSLPKPFYIHVKESSKGRKMNFDFLCATDDITQLKILEDELDGHKWFTEDDIRNAEDLIKPIQILALRAFDVYHNL